MAIVGIDLGTTNSAIAMVNEFGKPELIPNKEGERITSSVVLFDSHKVIVGSNAKIPEYNLKNHGNVFQ